MAGGHAPDDGGTMAGRAATSMPADARFSRDSTRLQTWHDYAATTEHGALYDGETRISGESRAGTKHARRHLDHGGRAARQGKKTPPAFHRAMGAHGQRRLQVTRRTGG